MNSIFKNFTILEFEQHFNAEDKCLAYLAEEKWKDGFVCRKCGNENYCKGKKPYSRRCTRCKTEESATANTIYHKCKFPLTEAFKITYLVCHDPGITTHKISDELKLRQMTCWKFKKKIEECRNLTGDFNILEKV